MMTLNVGFSRTIHVPHKRTRIECKNVTGIQIKGKWEDHTDPDHVELRRKLMAHKPFGPGWGIAGYALVEET